MEQRKKGWGTLKLRDCEGELETKQAVGARRKHTAPIFSVSGVGDFWKPRGPFKVGVPIWHGPNIQKLRTKAHISKSQDLQSKRWANVPTSKLY